MMREGFCASILQLDASICCVTRSMDRLLENAQRCQPENSSIYTNEEPNALKFRVRDHTDGYEYELADNRSYYQLTFDINGDILSVVIDNKQTDVVNLAESIAKFIRIQEDSKETLAVVSCSPRHGSPNPITHQPQISHPTR